MNTLKQSINQAMGIAQMGVFEWNIQTHTVTWDDALYRIFGTRREDFSTALDAWTKSIHPHDQERVFDEAQLAIHGKQDFNTSFKVIRNAGSIGYIRSVGFIDRDRDGVAIRMTGMNWDITREVVQEKEYRVQKEFYECLFQAVPDPIYVVNENFEIYYANKAFFDFMDSDLSLKELSDRFQVEIKNQLESVFYSNQSFEREIYFRLPNGKEVVVLMKGTPSVFLDGQKVAISTLRDISERKRMEDELEQVRALQVQASKLAALGEMAGGVAHEINNPLAVVDGKIQLLQRLFSQTVPPSTEVALGHLARAKEYAERIASIVRGVKNVSRTADQDPFVPFSIKDSIQDTLGTCSEKLRSEGVRIELDIPPHSDPKSTGRATQVSQILLNLINNSYDAILDSPVKKIKIEVEDGKSFWKVHVKDSGNGIPLAIRSKVMRPFFTTKPKGKGTGLGLSISNSIAETHKGKLYLNNEFKNTCFTLELPKYLRDRGTRA